MEQLAKLGLEIGFDVYFADDDKDSATTALESGR
jgi:hypothetical protein